MSNKTLIAGALAAGFATTLLSAPAQAQNLTTELVASGFARSVFMTAPKGDDTRFFVCEQHTGRIEIIDRTNNNQVLFVTPFLDVGVVATGNEQGLTGLAFHPEYMTVGHPKEGHFYVCYNAPGGGQTRVVEYEAMGGDPLANTANPTPVATIYTLNQPFSNHNGGMLAFGSDDMLYLSLGDGGGGGDPLGAGQDLTTDLGSILRFDVDLPSPHIPADNPFVGVAGNDRIWMWGLRNPWRFTFDSLNGDMYIGDVGQNAREEVNYAPGTSIGGENFGWACREGVANFDGSECSSPPFINPAWDISQTGPGGFHCSVIGGYVYRGSIPGLDGTYFWADYCSGSTWTGTINGSGDLTNVVDREFELDPTNQISQITAFAQDNDGEIYIIEQGGQIWKVIEDCNATAQTYCNASPNSFTVGGADLSVSTNSSLLLSDDNFSLSVLGATPNEFGLFVFGTSTNQVMIGDGVLCIGDPIFRILPPIQTDPLFGGAVYPIDLDDPGSGSPPIMPSTSYYWQFWYRDNNGPGGTGFNWSSGLETIFCP